MSYVDRHLNKGETVTFRTSLHPVVWTGTGVITIVALALMMSSDSREIGTFFLGLAIVVAIWTSITVKTSEFAVTTSRVIIKVGWLSQRTIELQLSKIEGVSVAQDLFGRMFDFGSIIVGGTGGTKEPFGFIRSPLRFRKEVQQQIDNLTASSSVAPATQRGDVAGAPREERECPHCAERILVKATRCRFCNQLVDATSQGS